MMASDDKANYVVSYFTFELADMANHTCENLPICEYEVVTDTEIINSEELIENSTIDNCSNDDDSNDNINPFEIVARTEEIHSDDLIEDDENDENNNNHTEDDDDDDDLADLTNLNWLTELKNITNLPPAANEITEKPCDPPSQRFDKFIIQVNKMKENYEKRKSLYQTVPNEKPPFNYAQIIGMALLDEGRMTLKQICDWIEKRFAYYKMHKNWNVSLF